MMKVTALYGHPTNPDEFEKYYGGTHLPLAAKMKGVVAFLGRLQLLTCAPGYCFCKL